jgi:transcriptional regulator with GAF, ATPase, and Fis domain
MEREGAMTVEIQDGYFIGSSPLSRQLSLDIELAARSDAKVLITGETGVGKDVVARLIHKSSGRGRAPLSTINCAGLPDALLESELFGHVKGSFTGAFRDKAGLLEVADRGTAFLDEAGEMSLRMQGMLLRFLETGEVQRVGSERTARHVNVRILAATNRDLAQQIGAGAFREDLFYRLNVIRIHVAPLRDRRDDIPGLFGFFATRVSAQYGVAPRRLTREAERLLAGYAWPGNVRELKNVVERLAVKAPGSPVEADDVPEECRGGQRAATWRPAARPSSVAAFQPVASRPAASAPPTVDSLLRRLMHEGESFWSVVHAPFMSRDLSRDQLRAVIGAGLERTCGNYRILVDLFNMPGDDYKRFLSFLRKHDCQVPFHPYRALRCRETGIDSRHAPAV